jgi:hypothetical protein
MDDHHRGFSDLASQKRLRARPRRVRHPERLGGTGNSSLCRPCRPGGHRRAVAVSGGEYTASDGVVAIFLKGIASTLWKPFN